MKDYKKIAKDLRECDGFIMQKKLDDAADAIEELQAEVERLKEGNEELREQQTYIDQWGAKWMTSAKDVPTSAYQHGYADGFAEAKQKLRSWSAPWVRWFL